MQITDLAIRRPVFAIMLVAAFVGFGAVSFTRVGVDLFPEVSPGIVTVTTVLEGATPEAIETEITDVLEEELSGISGIDELTSQSRDGLSLIVTEFDLAEDIDVKSQDVRDKVSRALGELPRDARSPIVEKFNLGSAPILSVMISGPLTIRELTDFADDVVKERLQKISGVGAISIEGGREREIRIWVDGSRLRSYGLTVDDVARAIGSEHVDVPGGRIEAAGRTAEFAVKTKGEVNSVAEFADLVIAYRAGAPTKLGDVARIEDGLTDERTFAELDGVTGVSLGVRKQSGRNTVEIARAVRVELASIREIAPEGVRLIFARDNSRFIESAAGDVGIDLILGGGLAMLATLIFLRSLRTTLIVGIAIPTCVISTFILFYAMGFTLNMFSMMALSVSIGLLVDDAIVVLESIHRRVAAGEDPMRAASVGTNTVSTALFAGTLSILSVFVPIAFMQGFVGRYFFEYGLSISFAVLMSLMVALTLTPMLCSRLLKPQETHGPLYRFFERGFQGIEKAYGVALAWALGHRIAVVALAVAATTGGVFLAGLVPVSLDPKVDRGEFQALVELPTGAGIEQSKQVGARASLILSELPHVTAVSMTVGSSGRGRINEALLYVQLEHKQERTFSQFELQDLAREKLKAALPEARRVSVFKVDWAEGGGFSTFDLEYSLLGPDLDTLAELADEIVGKLGIDGGFQDTQSSFQIGKPEIQVQIDRRRAADLGTPVRSVADTVRALIGGVEVGTYEEDGERHDIRVRLEESQRDDITELGRIQVRAADRSLVDLANVASLEIAPAPVQIDRRDRSRQVKVFANVIEGVAEGTAIERLDAIVAETNFPPGYTHKHAGQTERAKESAADIGFAFLMALVALYMVIASQFNSFTQPLIIMVTAPLSFVGAFAGLYLTNTEFSIFAQIGMLALMGLVMKNGILLVDYANQRVEQGVPARQAMAEAGPARLRPVMMTAVSTVAGMVPVAIATSDAAEWRTPMGILIIGGLSSSMILTLVVAPVAYTLLADAEALIARWRTGSVAETPGSPDAAPGR